MAFGDSGTLGMVALWERWHLRDGDIGDDGTLGTVAFGDSGTLGTVAPWGQWHFGVSGVWGQWHLGDSGTLGAMAFRTVAL